MAEDKKEKQISKPEVSPSSKPGSKTAGKAVYTDRKKKQIKTRRTAGRRRDRIQDEFEQRIVDIARVTRVMAGGKRMRFRACVAVGNKKGKIGYGLAKGADVTIAVTKAVTIAKKNTIEIPIVNDTIPHEVYHKYKAAKILLRPARKGRGVIAGGAARIVLELAGIKNVTSKILGTNNKVNIVKCIMEALDSLKKIEVKKEKKKEKINSFKEHVAPKGKKEEGAIKDKRK